MSIDLTKKFIEGLKNYNLTYNDILNNNFYYCGGDNNSHLNYFKLIYNDKKLPEKKEKCICGHEIRDNCYITDGNIILILGNCCIKKFLPKDKSGRTCEKCGKPHKNRKYNICNDCKYNLSFEEQKQQKELIKKRERIYINVSYKEKDDAKILGAKWDNEKKTWYAPNLTYKELIEKFQK
jgi:hypothetical protein